MRLIGGWSQKSTVEGCRAMRGARQPWRLKIALKSQKKHSDNTQNCYTYIHFVFVATTFGSYVNVCAYIFCLIGCSEVGTTFQTVPESC